METRDETPPFLNPVVPLCSFRRLAPAPANRQTLFHDGARRCADALWANDFNFYLTWRVLGTRKVGETSKGFTLMESGCS